MSPSSPSCDRRRTSVQSQESDPHVTPAELLVCSCPDVEFYINKLLPCGEQVSATLWKASETRVTGYLGFLKLTLDFEDREPFNAFPEVSSP